MKYPIIGYASKWSVEPGDNIAVMVSCRNAGPFHATVVRLLHNDPRVDGPDFREEALPHEVNGEYPGFPQPVHRGSAGVVTAHGMSAGSGLSMLATIWPTLLCGKRQSIIHSSSGNGLISATLAIAEGGELELILSTPVGNFRLATNAKLAVRSWYRVWATIDALTGDLSVGFQGLKAKVGYGSRVIANGKIRNVKPWTPERVVFAAASGSPPEGPTKLHFNGKIERPLLYSRALSNENIPLAFGGDPPRAGLIGAWDFSREMKTDHIVDLGPNNLHGRLLNAPTRAMTGSNWTSDYRNWPDNPERYGAIHFHEDDLSDCCWEPSIEISVPKTWTSGVYAIKLLQGKGEYYVPFIVRPGIEQARSDLVVLLPTATYQVYGNHSSAPANGYSGMKRIPAASFEEARNGPVAEGDYGYSGYFTHSDGSGISICSRLRPIVEFRPKFARMADAKGLGVDKFGLDLYLLSWLDSRGIAFDIVTDEDLDREGLRLIGPYRVLMTGSHPEYVSKNMLDAIEQFISDGGRLMYMGGDGFDIRVAYDHNRAGLLEIRRDVAGGGSWESEPGEECSAFDGCPMGSWGHLGRPSHQLVGVGFAAQCELFSGGPFQRAPDSNNARVAFIFAGVDDDVLGDFGVATGAAAGHELDRSDKSRGTPEHALILATAEDLGPEWLPFQDDLGISKNFSRNAKVRGEMVFFETPAGGAVFSAGSTTYVGSLSYNIGENAISAITENVLRRFLDPTSFSTNLATDQNNECAYNMVRRV